MLSGIEAAMDFNGMSAAGFRGMYAECIFRAMGAFAADVDTHVQVSVLNPITKQMVEVDDGMVPTLKALWDRGFNTEMSCQDQGGLTWVEFPEADFKRLNKAAQTRGTLYKFFAECLTNFTSNVDPTPEEELEYSVGVRFPAEFKPHFCSMIEEL